MLDAVLTAHLKAPLAWLAKPLLRVGVSANQMTVAGFVCGLVSALCITQDWMLWALVALAANRLCDGLDGALARLTRPTRHGAFLDIVFDFLIYSLIPLAFAVRDGSDAMAAAFLIFCFVGTGSTFLAFSIFAKEVGLTNQRLVEKSMYYLEGLTEGFETLVILALMIIVPAWFSVLAYGFGVLCLVTTATRIWQGVHQLKQVEAQASDQTRSIQ